MPALPVVQVTFYHTTAGRGGLDHHRIPAHRRDRHSARWPAGRSLRSPSRLGVVARRVRRRLAGLRASRNRSSCSLPAASIQGLGAGVGPLAASLVREHVAAARVPRAIGLIVGAGGAGGVIGLLGGALLVDHVSVHAIFWLLGAIGGPVARRRPPGGAVVRRPRRRCPSTGSVRHSWAARSSAVSLAVAEGNAWGWGSPRVLGLFAGCALAARRLRRARTHRGRAAARSARPRAPPAVERAARGVRRRHRPVGGLRVDPVPRRAAREHRLRARPGPDGDRPRARPQRAGRAARRSGRRAPRDTDRRADTGHRRPTLHRRDIHACWSPSHPSAVLVALAMLPLGFGVGVALSAPS